MREDRIESKKTFEERLKLLAQFYAQNIQKFDIMTLCIEEKLDRSFLNYNEDLARNITNLHNRDPLLLLKKLK